MQEQQQQLIAKLKEAQNVLITVSKNPSVDQLAAAIGFTLALNKLDKHATAVFSGQIPSTIEFLKPEETLEKSTDSLRDFIIALDKSKADKLRYKVEDQVVRIFITPYRTSISEKDLDFSQGDFNVDVIVALGVPEQQDLDEAIQAHGRILHDATIASLSLGGSQGLGTLNIADEKASSLSEMVTELVNGMSEHLVDSQIATALLTGIVAMTNRFSNDRTTPKTMSVSSALMAAGANQQLIATELETPETVQPRRDDEQSDEPSIPEPPKDPGMLEINHENGSDTAEEPTDPDTPQIQVDEEGRIVTAPDSTLPKIGQARASGEMESQPEQESLSRTRMVEPPSRDSALSANTEEEGLDAPTGDLLQPTVDVPMLSHEKEPKDTTLPPAQLPPVPETAPSEPMNTPPPEEPIDTATETLSQIEQRVDSPHLASEVPPSLSTVDEARNAVQEAYRENPAAAAPNPIAALNAQPLGPDLHAGTPEATPEATSPSYPTYQPAPGFGVAPQQPADGTVPGTTPSDQTLDMPLPNVPNTPPPSSFPGVAPANPEDDTLPPPPPVPPPPIFPA